MKIIGIAGGSGAGKSTVSYELQDERPDLVEVLNFDDYQKLAKPRPADIPMVEDMINWDHPDVIRWDDLLHDLRMLKTGRAVTLLSWAHRSNPNYHLSKEMVTRTIKPTPILIVEGYLALYNPEVRKLYNTSFYLDIDEPGRQQRRRTARGGKDTLIGRSDYVEKVLKPMHKQFVEPTKQYANYVIDVSNLSIEAVCNEIKKLASF